MGRWMEALNKNEEVVLEMAPNFIIYCSRNLPKKIRTEFPVLLSLELISNKWIDELQAFKSEKITERSLSSKRERIINVVEVYSFTLYINLISLFCSF
ncbi:hypothetical protein [Kordia sp.]|uniref:hypothetical protein n=1 Tax=Kordia sp. TaxID=1965332 RepID=UPI003D2A24CE